MAKELIVYGADDDDIATKTKTLRIVQSAKTHSNGIKGVTAGLLVVFILCAIVLEVFDNQEIKDFARYCLLVAFVGIIFFGNIYLKFGIEDLITICPHCSHKIKMYASWHCGICDNLNEHTEPPTIPNYFGNTVSTIADKCSEEVCGRTSPAFRCPECKQTIPTYPDEHREHPKWIARFAVENDAVPEPVSAARPSSSPLDRDLE